jgi:hypothetical protein
MIGHARMIAGKTWILQNDVTECYGGFEACQFALNRDPGFASNSNPVMRGVR